MSVDSISPIEAAVHAANRWINELAEELGWQDRRRAYVALRAVLHALRDRLTTAEVIDLGAQLPMVIRGMYYEGWRPSDKPNKERKKEEFLAHIAAAFRDEAGVYPEGIAWGVFSILQRHISGGEIGDIQHVLPAQIRSLWPGGQRAVTT